MQLTTDPGTVCCCIDVIWLVPLLVTWLFWRCIRFILQGILYFGDGTFQLYINTPAQGAKVFINGYVWVDPKHDGLPPCNWLSVFGGSAWAWNEATGEYFLHLFSQRQPDLNWESPAVRAEVWSLMRFWLARGVDGFRMDVINMISKDPALPDGVVHGGIWGDGTPHFLNGPRIHDYLQEMHREVFAGRTQPFLTVGETPGCTVEQARLYTDAARAEVDMVFQFEHVEVDREEKEVSRRALARERQPTVCEAERAQGERAEGQTEGQPAGQPAFAKDTAPHSRRAQRCQHGLRRAAGQYPSHKPSQSGPSRPSRRWGAGRPSFNIPPRRPPRKERCRASVARRDASGAGGARRRCRGGGAGRAAGR